MNGMNWMHVSRSSCIFRVYGKFPETAWQAVHSRQAAHVF